jgi:succinoglycan biosynthesis transport protein ExoP
MQSQASDNEIDLKALGSLLIRRWPILLSGVFFGVGGAVAANNLTKPTWGGGFEIVLAKAEIGGGLASLVSGNPLLGQLTGIAGSGMDSGLETEIKILESPLVLRPIFEYVKTTKMSYNSAAKELRFDAWLKKSLRVKLNKGTSVLNITYTDRNKSLILPVLQKISEAYQAYSGRDRIEALNRGLNYVNIQVQRFRQEAEAANRDVDTFSIRYGIPKQGGSIASAGVDTSSLLNSNQGRSNRQGGGALLNLGGSSTATSGGSINQGEALSQLAAINRELIRRQQMFTERDPVVISLQRERDAMRKYIETTAGGNLGLPGETNLSKEQAQNIMLRYQELDRIARRKTAILDSLERSQQSLELEQARSTRPWELISNPTVFEEPVSPKPLRNLAVGLFAGLIVGGGAALWSDRRSGGIYTVDELKSLLPYPLLSTLSAHNETSWQESLKLLALGPLANAAQVALIPTDADPRYTRVAEQLQQLLVSTDPAAQLLFTQDLAVARRCNAQLLITGLGKGKRDDIKRLRQNLQLQGQPVAGLLMIDNAA